MFEQQGYGCNICRIIIKPYTRYGFVDHCHRSGKVRGILCQGCNTGLGHFKDNTTNLKGAIIYLMEAELEEGESNEEEEEEEEEEESEEEYRPTVEQLKWLRYTYRLNQTKYIKMFRDQSYACAICKTEVNPFTLHAHVDHDHRTGKVRGILCRHCNLGIGHFRENTGALENAIRYLTQLG